MSLMHSICPKWEGYPVEVSEYSRRYRQSIIPVLLGLSTRTASHHALGAFLIGAEYVIGRDRWAPISLGVQHAAILVRIQAVCDSRLIRREYWKYRPCDSLIVTVLPLDTGKALIGRETAHRAHVYSLRHADTGTKAPENVPGYGQRIS